MSIQFVTQDCDICGKPVTSSGEGNFFIAQRHGACALVHLQEQPMTVKELHTFTDAEIDIILDSLGVAASHYQMIVEKHGGLAFGRNFREEFLKQAQAARDLQLKIEASK